MSSSVDERQREQPKREQGAKVERKAVPPSTSAVEVDLPAPRGSGATEPHKAKRRLLEVHAFRRTLRP